MMTGILLFVLYILGMVLVIVHCAIKNPKDDEPPVDIAVFWPLFLFLFIIFSPLIGVIKLHERISKMTRDGEWRQL